MDFDYFRYIRFNRSREIQWEKQAKQNYWIDSYLRYFIHTFASVTRYFYIFYEHPLGTAWSTAQHYEPFWYVLCVDNNEFISVKNKQLNRKLASIISINTLYHSFYSQYYCIETDMFLIIRNQFCVFFIYLFPIFLFFFIRLYCRKFKNNRIHYGFVMRSFQYYRDKTSNFDWSTWAPGCQQVDIDCH